VDGASSQITSLLSAVGSGDAGAAERLWRMVADELHAIAKARLAGEGRRGDLQTTVLVQEAFLRLVGSGDGAAIPANRRHFFAAAKNAMRQFLVDDARSRGRHKRGDGRRPGAVGEAVATFDTDPAEVLAVDEALARPWQRDPRKADIAEYRFFVGLTIDETAEQLGLSPRHVDKEWQFAKAWLRRELSGER
jgi:RNA polymerase sigma factor (TIGR02999 family)